MCRINCSGGCAECAPDEHGGEWHSCPFQSEMNGNDDPMYCKCDPEKTAECAMEV